MSKEMLDVLKEQAERLLMVLPGHLNDATIETVQKQVRQMYEFDSRNPDLSYRAQQITLRMLNWISLCEWVMASMDPKNGINPSETGIFKWHTWGGEKTFAVYCEDLFHWQFLPKLVLFKGEEYSRINWNSTTKRCFYKLLGEEFVCCF